MRIREETKEIEQSSYCNLKAKLRDTSCGLTDWTVLVDGCLEKDYYIEFRMIQVFWVESLGIAILCK